MPKAPAQRAVHSGSGTEPGRATSHLRRNQVKIWKLRDFVCVPVYSQLTGLDRPVTNAEKGNL